MIRARVPELALFQRFPCAFRRRFACAFRPLRACAFRPLRAGAFRPLRAGAFSLLYAGAFSLLSACVSDRPDRFYILNPLPAGAAAARTTPSTQVTLRVKLPPWLDRPEMVLNSSAQGVTILEHERWAAPLADLVSQTLAGDLERRRADWVVADPGLPRGGGAVMTVTVNVAKLTIRPGDHASMEAEWRIADPRAPSDVVGEAEFTAPLGQGDYPAVAQALSEVLSRLADSIASGVPSPP